MNNRVLFVDDELQLLEGIRRTLHKKFQICTASSGAEALKLMGELPPFGLIVSDMRMPAMNGAQFLTKAREMAPDSVRMILSGQSDLPATICAVNEGHIYRFLTKPCAGDALIRAIEDGLRQYQLIESEKELLEQTLSGSIRMLIEVMGMVSPVASSRAARLHRYVVGLATALRVGDQWQWGLSALVSQIGCVALPLEVLSKIEGGLSLSGDELKLYESHPEIAAKLLAAIPRLEDVAEIVAAQFKPLSFAGKADDLLKWEAGSVGQLLLRSVVDFDRLILGGMTVPAAIADLRKSPSHFPAAVLQALSSLQPETQSSISRQVKVKDLLPGMILDQDLMSTRGIRLVPAGQEVTCALIVRLNSIANGVGVSEPFMVRTAT